MHRLILKKIGHNFLSKEANLNLLNNEDLEKICKVIKIKKYIIDSIKILGFRTNLILIVNKN